MKMDQTKLNMGVYFMGPKTEENLLDLKRAGIDFVIDRNFSTETLDLFAKNGMGVFLMGVLPGWWGNSGKDAGKMKDSIPLENYASSAEAIPDHPAIWGVDIGDEPNALDLPYYGEAIGIVQAKVPQSKVYLNLFPVGATTNQTVGSPLPYSQLEVDRYSEYIATYLAGVKTDYICYDHYPFGDNRSLNLATMTRWYDNLEIVSNACRETNRSFWIVVQCNNDDPNGYWLQENKMEYQAFTAMAYGAVVVTWGCWAPGWYHHSVLDANGVKTEQYDKLKQANAQVKGIADAYMKFKNIATHYVGFAEGSVAYDCLSTPTKGYKEIPESKYVLLKAFSNGIFKDVTSPDGGSMVVGEMVARNGDGKTALMIADATDLGADGYEKTVSFRVEGKRTVTLHQGMKETVLTPDATGTYRVTMAMGGGFLLTVTAE